MWDIFLSHSKADREFVRQLKQDLNKVGLRVWFDDCELKVGDSLREKIEEGIIGSGFLGVVLSPSSVKSKWVRSEINAAFSKEMNDKSVFILPILYKKCSIPPFLCDKLYADFTTSYEKGFSLLLSRFNQVAVERIDQLNILANQTKIKNILNENAKKIESNIFLITDDKNVISSDNVPMPEYCQLLRNKSAKYISTDFEVLERIKETRSTEVYECHSGLVDFVVPIFLNGEVRGGIFSGQKRLRETDEITQRRLQELDNQFGLDKNTLQILLNRIKKETFEGIKSSMKVLINIAKEIGKILEGNKSII